MTAARRGRKTRPRQKIAARQLLVHALVKAGISTLIALIGATIFFVSDLRYWGADLSQTILVQFDGGSLGFAPEDGAAAGLRPVPEQWAFVDIGPRFCATQAGRRPACPPETARTDPAALAQLLAWVVALRPRVVLLDIEAIRTVDELQTAAALLPTSSAQPVPILVALPFEPESASSSESQVTIVLDDRAAQLMAASRATSIRFRPTLIRAPVPAARLLMTEVRVAGGSQQTRLDTISFAAALVARTPGADPFALIENSAPTNDNGNCAPVSATCRALFARTERVFSFQPVLPADDPEARVEAQVRAADGLRTFYVPAPLPEQLAAGSPGGGLEDAVVVIGDSRIAAQDRPWTALGDVSGAEVHLNDIRQFSYLRPAPDSLGSYLWAEFPLLLLGFAVVAAVEGLLGLRRSRHPAVPYDSLRYPLASLTSLLLIAAVSGLASYAYLFLQRGSSHGVPDIVSPIVGLLALSALEFFFRLIAWIEARFGMEH